MPWFGQLGALPVPFLFEVYLPLVLRLVVKLCLSWQESRNGCDNSNANVINFELGVELFLPSKILRNEGANDNHQSNTGGDALTSDSCGMCPLCFPHSQVCSGRCVYSMKVFRRAKSFLRLPLPSLRDLVSSIICWGEAERSKIAYTHVSLARAQSHSYIRVQGRWGNVL